MPEGEDRKQNNAGVNSPEPKTDSGPVQGPPKTLTLTEEELRAWVDQAVLKALEARTANPEKQTKEKEDDLTAVAKFEARERELNETQTALNAVRKQLEGLLSEIEKLVAAELDTLEEADRKLAEAAFPGDAPPLLKLKVLRALKNAGKLELIGGRTPGKVGVPIRPGGQEGEPSGGNREFNRLYTLGKSYAERKRAEEGIVPEAWKGR